MKMKDLSSYISLQFITHYTNRYTYYDSAYMALQGGCRWIQLRIKDAPAEVIIKEARRIQKLCRDHDAIFIIDDHVELVRELKADGVHLGKNDIPIEEARQLLGQDFIIGGTANTFNDVKSHYEHGADYIGCGPFRFTTTKKNLSPILGLDGYRSITRQMDTNGIQIPIVAIGGITNDDIPAIIQTGMSGIALSSSILKADSPTCEIQKVINTINANIRNKKL